MNRRLCHREEPAPSSWKVRRHARYDAGGAQAPRRCRGRALARAEAPRPRGMTGRPVPRRHWRSYGDDPLPTSREALNEPFGAFPSWFMRITCDRCGKDQMKHRATEAFRAVERRVRDNVVCAPITGKEVMIGLAEAAVVQIRANDLNRSGQALPSSSRRRRHIPRCRPRTAHCR